MKTASYTLLTVGGLLLATPFADGDSRRSSNRTTITITYTYRTYGS